MFGGLLPATANRTGIFQQADGGTLLLDEIGDMSSNLQAKLLRVLAEGKIVPLGAERPLAVNVRLLAATHRDLGQQVKEGKFREDLFYRLNVINIHVSPLRERHEDIIALANIFLPSPAILQKIFQQRRGIASKGIHGRAMYANYAM